MKNLIIDCYTDEPSGLGTPPYLSVHSRYLAGALCLTNQDYDYINIDDLRIVSGETLRKNNSLNKRVINHTKKLEDTIELLSSADRLYIVMGCFVSYDYLSCEPPTFEEVERLLSQYKNKEMILMYALGSKAIAPSILSSGTATNLFTKIVFGNFYNYILYNDDNNFLPKKRL